jgi:hypothetical protein
LDQILPRLPSVASCSGSATKIDALTDAECRPIVFVRSDGNVADCTVGAHLRARLPICEILHGDKG